MGNIERWTICRFQGKQGFSHSWLLRPDATEPAENDELEVLDVVRADTYDGAVEALRPFAALFDRYELVEDLDASEVVVPYQWLAAAKRAASRETGLNFEED